MYALTSAPRIELLSPSVNDANVLLALGPNALRFANAAWPAENIPISFAPAEIGNAERRRDAGGAGTRKRIGSHLARANQDPERQRRDRAAFRGTGLEHVIDRVVERTKLQDRA